jgi:hypothetical protein
VILDHLTRGDLFGEKHWLRSRRVHQVAKTLSPAKVVVLRKAEFFRRLHRDHRLAERVLKNLVLRMERYEETIRNFATEPTERRPAPAPPAAGFGCRGALPTPSGRSCWNDPVARITFSESLSADGLGSPPRGPEGPTRRSPSISAIDGTTRFKREPPLASAARRAYSKTWMFFSMHH